MSKKLKNYPDPMEVVGKYGADAVRLFLVNSPVVRGDNLRFREEGVREILTNVLLKWINSLNFYLGQVELYERASGKKFVNDHDAPKSKNVMDRWILASCQTLIQHVDKEMAGECPRDTYEMAATDISLPIVHCHTKTVEFDCRLDKLVHSIQPNSTKGIRRRRGHSCCSQHPIRGPLYLVPHLGRSISTSGVRSQLIPVILHPLHCRDGLPVIESYITQAKGWRRCPFRPLPIIPQRSIRVL